MTTDDFIPHLERFPSYEDARQSFRWNIPHDFNIADAVCRRHPDAVTRPALIEVRPAAENIYTFNAINFLADKFATVIAQDGIGKGDRVAAVLRQSAAVPVAHLGALKVGASVVPLSPSLDPPTLDYRIRDSGAVCVVVDFGARRKLDAFIGDASGATTVFVATDLVVGEQLQPNDRNFWAEIYRASSDFPAVDADAGAPAFLFYGSSSEPVVCGHHSLIGHLPAFEMCNNLSVADDDVFWTPGDWGNAASLLGFLYAAWAYGRPVVACESDPFDGALATETMKRCAVTSALLAPDEIEALLGPNAFAGNEPTLALRNVICGDGTVSGESRLAIQARLGASVSQCHGWPGAAGAVADCDRWFPPRPGSLGRTVPGHRIAVLDEGGNEVSSGIPGRLALSKRAPFLAYPEEAAALTIGEWTLTGDIGYKDEEGYVWIAITKV